MKSMKVEFDGAHGHRLAARLELPAGSMDACAIFAHCFTCSKDVKAASRISRALANRGVAVLRFDFTGLGGSDGDFANTTFSSNVDDLVAAARYLAQNWDAPTLLVGHSLGGAAVIHAASKIDGILAVATIGAPYNPAHVEHIFASDVEAIEESGSADVTIAGRSFTVRREFLEDLRAADAAKVIGALKRPLLVMHAPRDEVVALENARKIYDAARHPKSFVSLDDADHMLSNSEDGEYVAEVLAAWGARYVTRRVSERRARFQATHNDAQEVVVRETGAGKFSAVATTDAHVVLADEPADYGGDDSGPSPYEYLLTALGACTTMTMRMYVERKGWPVDRLEARLSHAKVHAKDCHDCVEVEGARKLDRVVKHVVIEGDLTDEQRQKIFEIAAKCPVHRTLQTPTTIVSELVEDM